MKLYDENKNYVADIPKPEPIEQDGKWWEFTGLEAPEKGKEYLNYNGNKIFKATYDWQKFDIRWIASEIPRATPEKLRAIGMKERDGRPVKITPENYSDIIWTGKYVSGYKEHIGKYRFVLVPDVQEEKHTSCEGCEYETGKHLSPCNSCCSRGERKNYTPPQPPMDGYRLLEYGEVVQEGDEFLTGGYWIKTNNPGHVFGAKEDREMQMNYRRKIAQPPQPEEPRFSVKQIDDFLRCYENYYAGDVADELNDPLIGIAAITERRRG